MAEIKMFGMMKFSCSANNSGILDNTPRYPVARANQNYGRQEYECAHSGNNKTMPGCYCHPQCPLGPEH